MISVNGAAPKIEAQITYFRPTRSPIGLFFGFAFGVAGIASAVLGNMADRYGIEAVYNVCGYMPLIGLVTWFLPDLKKKR